jgi:hypothetical protein
MKKTTKIRTTKHTKYEGLWSRATTKKLKITKKRLESEPKARDSSSFVEEKARGGGKRGKNCEMGARTATTVGLSFFFCWSAGLFGKSVLSRKSLLQVCSASLFCLASLFCKSLRQVCSVSQVSSASLFYKSYCFHIA